MEKEELINKAELLLLKGIKVILSVLILFCTLTILPMHFAVPFFPILFLVDVYLVYIFQRPIIIRDEWKVGIKYEINLLKYTTLPILAAEIFVIIYYHEVTFPFLEKVMIDYING